MLDACATSCFQRSSVLLSIWQLHMKGLSSQPVHTPGSSVRLKLALNIAGQHVCEVAQEGAIV